MRTLFLAAVFALTAVATGCSGLAASAMLPATRGASDYDPQAPAIKVPSLDTALTTASWISGAGVQVTALDSVNHVDQDVLSALRVAGSTSNLTLSSTRSFTSVALYVKYDAAKLHPTEMTADRPGAVSLIARIRPGVLAIGVAGNRGQLLKSSIPLAQLSFAAGADTTVVRAPSVTNLAGNSVPDLVAVDNVNSTATLSWSERHTGDYDQNGVVNISDLSPLGKYLGETSASADWTKAEVADGDYNTQVNISDLTPLGANLGSTIVGYDVYRTLVTGPTDDPDPADTARWTKVDNTGDPSGPSAPRVYNGQKTRLTYTFIDSSGDGEYAWYVAAVSGPDEPSGGKHVAIGPASNVIKQTVTPAGPPPAGLSFEIVSPATEFATVGDEFYVAVKVTGVTDLFSANVRFEYDSDVVQFEEGVASYNDGTDHPNFLSPPLFVTADNVDSATSPYVLLGFNATETQGTPTVSGDGYLGYFKFKAIGAGIVDEAFRFPQSSNFIYLWGSDYGVAVAAPALGSPQLLNVAP